MRISRSFVKGFAGGSAIAYSVAGIILPFIDVIPYWFSGMVAAFAVMSILIWLAVDDKLDT